MPALIIKSRSRYSVALFFFQAEDGIRDVAVTGVQTCALPILCSPSSAACKKNCRKIRRSPNSLHWSKRRRVWQSNNDRPPRRRGTEQILRASFVLPNEHRTCVLVQMFGV